MHTGDTYRLSLREYQLYFHKLYPSLCMFGNQYINDIEVSKDIVQDAFVKIWEDQIEFKSENCVKSYLYTSVKNKSLDYIKSKHFKSTFKLSTINLEALESESFFLREVVVHETSALLEEAINTLPDRCAQVIRMSIKEFSNAEIADNLSLSINTIKTHKKIAYKRLKPLLKEHFLL